MARPTQPCHAVPHGPSQLLKTGCSPDTRACFLRPRLFPAVAGSPCWTEGSCSQKGQGSDSSPGLESTPWACPSPGPAPLWAVEPLPEVSVLAGSVQDTCLWAPAPPSLPALSLQGQGAFPPQMWHTRRPWAFPGMG